MLHNDTDHTYDHDEDVYYTCNEGYRMARNSSYDGNDGAATCINGTREIPYCIIDRKQIQFYVELFIRFKWNLADK